MREVGIELPEDPPRSVSVRRAEDYDLMVVLRPRDVGNVPPLSDVRKVMDWSFAPSGDPEESEPEERPARPVVCATSYAPVSDCC